MRLIYLNLIFSLFWDSKFRGNFSSHPPQSTSINQFPLNLPLLPFPAFHHQHRNIVRGATITFRQPRSTHFLQSFCSSTHCHFVAALRKNSNNRNHSKPNVMDKLSNEEIEMLFQVAEKESPTFSKLYKETLEKANSRPPKPLKDYQSLYDQVDEVISSWEYALSDHHSHLILECAGSLFRSTLAQQVSIVKNDIDSRSSPEEVENALRCLANMALMFTFC
jgi:hypothetical protein